MADDRNGNHLMPRLWLLIAGCLLAAITWFALGDHGERAKGWSDSARRTDPAAFATHLDGLLNRSREGLVAVRDRLAKAPVPEGGQLGESAVEREAAAVASLIERLDAARRELAAQREMIASKVTREVSGAVVTAAQAVLDDAESLIRSDVPRRAEAR